MVARGIGLTVLPRASVANMHATDGMLAYRPFADPVPSRRVVMLWRKSFTRKAAIDALCAAIASCKLPGITQLRDDEG